jgi:hypothetical protein
MFNVKPKVISVIKGVTGTISKSFRQYLYNIPRKREIKETFHGRNNITCSTNCKHRPAASLYTLEAWFVTGR